VSGSVYGGGETEGEGEGEGGAHGRTWKVLLNVSDVISL
jgi:hypothetical protein